MGGTALGAMQWGARVKSWAGLKSYNWQTVAWFENQSTIMLAYMYTCVIWVHYVSLTVILCPKVTQTMQHACGALPTQNAIVVSSLGTPGLGGFAPGR